MRCRCPDCELMAAIASRDDEAFTRLRSLYARMLGAVAYRFVRDECDAEEIAADVMWQARRDAQTFDCSRTTLGGWLFVIARSRALDRVRGLRRHRCLEIPAPPVPEDPFSMVARAEHKSIAMKALREIGEAARRPLELRYFREMSDEKIALELGVPLGTVKTRIRSALGKLRDKLEGTM